jgi:pimeloyl-ACP methyl ester carboxylesterase
VPISTLPGITATTIATPRLTTRVLFGGPDTGKPVLFIHGNGSSATYWEETMLALPVGFRGIAPDLRGYGDADQARKIDAKRGMADVSDDLLALLDYLKIDKAHVVGHSLGGSVIWQLMIDASPRILSVTLIAPCSPYGFGGTKGIDGLPCFPDFAGSGGGVVNVEFTQLMEQGDRSSDKPVSPRVVMNSFYWKPPFIPAREEDLLSSLLSEHVGPQEYPGDMTPSTNWPMVAPGVWGGINASSAKYVGDVTRLYRIPNKPEVLWVRGSHDQIVSDQSLFELGMLGQLGAIPGWPGADIFPPQPMVGQTRAVLEKYTAAGGSFSEVVIEDTGHSPYIEKPAEFNTHFHALLQKHG